MAIDLCPQGPKCLGASNIDPGQGLGFTQSFTPDPQKPAPSWPWPWARAGAWAGAWAGPGYNSLRVY
jgi:hypothetical protein